MQLNGAFINGRGKKCLGGVRGLLRTRIKEPEVSMINQILLFTASVFLFAWGVAHLFPTKSVVKGFGDISIDNQRILTMEWINEGATLMFIGMIVFSVTAIDPQHVISKTVFRLSFLMLNILAVISIFTGARVHFLPYKLCPVIFITSALLIILGCYL